MMRRAQNKAEYEADGIGISYMLKGEGPAPGSAIPTPTIPIRRTPMTISEAGRT